MSFVHVDYTLFTAAVTGADKSGKYKTAAAIHKAAAELYNEAKPADMKPIDEREVRNRIKFWDLKLSTNGKKKAVVVEPKTVRKVMKELDVEGKFPNRTKLYEAVTAQYNKTKPAKYDEAAVHHITKQIEQLGLEINTPKGKLTGGQRPAAGPRRSRKDKLAEHPLFEAHLDALRENIIQNKAEHYLPLVDRIAEGNEPARRKLMCLRCFAYERKEVKHCTSLTCPNFLVRPYQDADLSVPDELSQEELQPLETAEAS